MPQFIHSIRRFAIPALASLAFVAGAAEAKRGAALLLTAPPAVWTESPSAAWRQATADRLRQDGRIAEADAVQRQTLPPNWLMHASGDLGLALRTDQNGIQLESVYDLNQLHELLAPRPLPLFSLKLQRTGEPLEKVVTADRGWSTTRLQKTPAGFALTWSQPQDPELWGIEVQVNLTAAPPDSAVHWEFAVANPNSYWSVQDIIFPQVALADLGAEGVAFFPRGPGETQTNVWARPFRYRGNYPGGWCAMQYLAAYRPTPPALGLYLGLHDPWGSTKDLAVESDPSQRRLVLRAEWPAPDQGRAANSVRLSGPVVWQLLRGDWYDAARIYKAWVQRDARWWPRSSNPGRLRADTPAWFRALDLWALGGGATSECLPAVRDFQKAFDVPVGFHWYNWHRIPFDNDYPHYFPAKEGFAQGVTTLRALRVYPMPYINGRLWDTHDRGAGDFEFSWRALPSATKQADGQPFVETYGSKETNGEPVRLAAMCPTTPLWQQTIRQIVLQLLQEMRTSAVYIDQVAAAAPTRCRDPMHGHPLGGGHWWNEGYWQMLDGLRSAMPRNAALTTECNAEPFIRWFDGYLTWHWQHDGQVPAFPAVYAGTIQMFGRAYRGGETQDLALRMKAGQQLVFGEQIGWIDPGVVKNPGQAEFLRLIVRTRQRLNAYFQAGEMLRPPRWTTPIPRVRADWQWSGEWWVNTDAVLTGAWQLPAERRLVLVFVNVSDEPVAAGVHFDLRDYGIMAARMRCEALETVGPTPPKKVLADFVNAARFLPRSVQTWELRW